MPPIRCRRRGKGRPSADDIALLKSGSRPALLLLKKRHRGRSLFADMLKALRDDLDKAAPRDRRFCVISP